MRQKIHILRMWNCSIRLRVEKTELLRILQELSVYQKPFENCQLSRQKEEDELTGEKIRIWREEEYHYKAAYGFCPFLTSYMHEELDMRPAMLIVPGGAYRNVSPSEAHLPALEFYGAGYNVFVLSYTVNYLDELKAPLKLQPLHDISRAVRVIRKNAESFHIDYRRIAVCGFSAGGHLCASLCVHRKDVRDPDAEYDRVSNRPDAAVLCYPVITSGEYANRESFLALLGENPDAGELAYMSLENYVTGDVPPCFLWQTATDASVPVENSYLFAKACKDAGVPYAHHVFADGIHGLSVATEEWLERKFGEPYTLKQIRLLADAVDAGDTPCAAGKGAEILEKFGLNGKKSEKWTPQMKAQIRETLKETKIWTGLAEIWLKRKLNLRDTGGE